MKSNKVLELIAEGQVLNIDELIDIRQTLRQTKDYTALDAIRNYLDNHLVFIFDAPYGQEIHYLTEKYFRFKDKFENTKQMNKRKYVEYRIQQDSRAERLLDSWIYSQRVGAINSKTSAR